MDMITFERKWLLRQLRGIERATYAMESLGRILDREVSPSEKRQDNYLVGGLLRCLPIVNDAIRDRMYNIGEKGGIMEEEYYA